MKKSGPAMRVRQAAGFGDNSAQAPHWVSRPAGTSLWLLECTLHGRGRIDTPGGVRYSECGHLFVFEPGAPQEYGMEPQHAQWAHFWVFFTPAPEWSELLTWPLAAPGLRELQLPPVAAREHVFAAMRQLVATQYGPWRRRETLARNTLAGVLLWAAEFNPEGGAPLLDPRVSAAMVLLGERYAEKLTVADLAEAVHLSPSRLAHLFQEQAGVSPMRYLEAQRVARARDLLLLTGNPVGQIAREVGFRDPYYFSRVFRQHTGQSPRQFRQQALAQPSGS